MTSTWHGWFTLGGVIKGAPAVVNPTPTTTDIYVQGMDDRLYQKWWDGSKWCPSDYGWLLHDDGDFRLGSSPIVVSPQGDQRDVYVRGQNGGVYHKYWDGQKWNGWYGLGGVIKGSPAVMNPTPSTIDIYVRGTDDRLYQKWWDGSKWSPSNEGWFLHDDGSFRLDSEPVVVGNNNRRDVFARGKDAGVWHKIWDGQKWSGWFSLGGHMNGKPQPVMVNQNVMDIYVQGVNNRVWQKWWDGSKWHPSDTGWMMHHDGNFRLGGSPAVVSSEGGGRRDLYARGEDGGVYHRFWDNQKQSNAVTVRSDAARSAKIDDFVNSIVKPDQPGVAVAVIKDGRIVHLAGYGMANLQTKTAITSETMFHMASTGKQLTALGIMMLKEQFNGWNLNYDNSLSVHLPQLSGYSQVTLRHLLTHTSGLIDLYGGEGNIALGEVSSNPTNADVIKAYVNLKFKKITNPGDKFAYINSDYDLLGSVIEKLSVQSYPEFFRTRVFDLLGMTDSFSFPNFTRMLDTNVAVGHEWGANGKFVAQPSVGWMDSIVGSGSFYASVYDLCAYEEGLAKNFLVSKESMQTAYTSGKTKDDKLTGYGFGWWRNENGGMPCVEHAGTWSGFNSWIRRYLKQALSIYVLANRPDGGDGLRMGIVNAATDAYK